MERLESKYFAKSVEILGDIGSSEARSKAFNDFLFVDESKLGISFMQVQPPLCLALNYSSMIFTITL